MANRIGPGWVVAPAMVLLVGCSGDPGRDAPGATKAAPATTGKLSHEQTLRWIDEHRAWRRVRKTRPIWVRELTPAEIGQEFQTADHVKEVAHVGAWLCVGIAGEPWFQAPEKVKSKYEPDGEEPKTFAFDAGPATYRRYKPKESSRNWAAKVEGPGIEGFFIKPGYDPDRPLYSPAGGYVVKDDAEDPYAAGSKDVWLVQQALFESTYEPSTP